MTPLSQSLSSEHHQAGQIDLELADWCAHFHNDPLGWALWAFDWGHGELRGFDGPDQWQREFLQQLGEEAAARRFDGVRPVAPVRFTTASGHG